MEEGDQYILIIDQIIIVRKLIFAVVRFAWSQ